MQPRETALNAHKPAHAPSAMRRLFSNRVFLFALHIALAVLPPLVYWAAIRGGSVADGNFQNTLVGLAIGTSLVWLIMSRLRIYAKSRLLSYVFPVNFLVFGGLLATIAVLRLEYSAIQLILGMTGAFMASFVATMMLRGSLKLQYVVPGGRTDEIRLEGQYVRAPSFTEIQSLVEAPRPEGAIIADLHHDHSPEWERLFAKASLAGIAVYHYRQVAETQTGQVRIAHLSENDLGSLIPNAPYMTTKRAIDIIASLILLPLLIIPFCLIGLLIKLDSAGSVFFIQERVGFRGQTFKMVKFRTMKTAKAEEDDDAARNSAMTKSGDDRITGIGSFLRKTRIDELPQIVNVLTGEMTWIGPRPEAKSLSEWYERELPFYSYRHIVRPGITGWAQVNQGHVTDVGDVNAKLRFDFYYIKNISMWLDLLIVFKTARVIITGIGAK